MRGPPVALQVGAQFLIVIGDALREGHHQGDRVVGDLPRAVIRHIADRNAQFAETLDVDVVVADAVLHEDAAVLQLVDVLRRATADDRVRVRPLLVGDVLEFLTEFHLEPGADRFGRDRYKPSRQVRPENAHRHDVSPSFDVVAMVPSPPRNDHTRATDRRSCRASTTGSLARCDTSSARPTPPAPGRCSRRSSNSTDALGREAATGTCPDFLFAASRAVYVSGPRAVRL